MAMVVFIASVPRWVINGINLCYKLPVGDYNVHACQSKPVVIYNYSNVTSKEPVCPRVELILKIIIILLIIFLGFIKSKPC